MSLLLGAVIVPAAAQTVVQVPGDQPTITAAVAAVPDGGVIEIADGIYMVPFGGLQLSNLNKSFTLRAAAGATVVLDGGGTSLVMVINNTLGTGKPMTFEGLTFRNGMSTNGARGGAVTVNRGEATFLGCTFEDNVMDSGNGGGALQLVDAEVYFADCTWSNNTATADGGAVLAFESMVYVHNSQFLNNRTNVAGHDPYSTGGGMSVVTNAAPDRKSRARISNTRFEGNQAGYAGGALFGLGRWEAPLATPQTETMVANCTFESNVAAPHAAVTPPAPTEGGGVHSEDHTTTLVYNSRFYLNEAERGGAVNLYRAITEVHDSVFRGNLATGTEVGSGLGGAFAAISNDTSVDVTNERPSTLEVYDSLVQGRYQTTTTMVGGAGVFLSGDKNSQYGQGGIGQAGTTAENRAAGVISNVAFYDCDAAQISTTNGTGLGGAIYAELADVTVSGSLVAASDATANTTSGGTGKGGGLYAAFQTLLNATGTTFADNLADNRGGACALEGATANFTAAQFLENDLDTGDIVTSRGAAIFSSPIDNAFGSIDMPAAGTVSGSLFNNQAGLPLSELDIAAGPVNAMVYNGNDFYNTSFGDDIFRSSIGGAKTVSELNSLTNKSTVDNTPLGSPPESGSLLAVPPVILPVTAAGDAMSSTESFLVYGWSGANATLDGGPPPGAGNSGLTAAGAGVHTLAVGGTDFTAEITNGAAPDATFTATPASIPPGGSSTLSWAVTSGTYLDMAIDQGVAETAAATGSVVVSPSDTKTYRFFAITEEGGIVQEVTVTVDPDLLFLDGFESGDVSAWSTSVGFI